MPSTEGDEDEGSSSAAGIMIGRISSHFVLFDDEIFTWMWIRLALIPPLVLFAVPFDDGIFTWMWLIIEYREGHVGKAHLSFDRHDQGI